MSQHDLAMHKKRSIKDLARGVDGGLDLCTKQTNIEITPGTLYVTKNLDIKPHGSADVNEKARNDEIVARYVGEKNVHDISHTVIQQIEPDSISVFRPGSEVMARQEVSECLHQEIFEQVMLNPSKFKTVGPRGIDHRVYFGFNQGQRNSVRINDDPNLKVPATHIAGDTFLNQINPTLKAELGKFFKFVQDVVVVDVNRGNALNNTNRANLLQPHFTEKHWPTAGLLWEFIDLNIRKNNGQQLRKHLDYKNDNRAGYNDVAVYTTIVHLNGEEYKMTYVLTSRRSCGSLVDRVVESRNKRKSDGTCTGRQTRARTTADVKEEQLSWSKLTETNKGAALEEWNRISSLNPSQRKAETESPKRKHQYQTIFTGMRLLRKAKIRANVLIQNALGLKQRDWFVEAKKNQADAMKDLQMLSEKYNLHDESRKNIEKSKLDKDATLKEDSSSLNQSEINRTAKVRARFVKMKAKRMIKVCYLQYCFHKTSQH